MTSRRQPDSLDQLGPPGLLHALCLASYCFFLGVLFLVLAPSALHADEPGVEAAGGAKPRRAPDSSVESLLPPGGGEDGRDVTLAMLEAELDSFSNPSTSAPELRIVEPDASELSRTARPRARRTGRLDLPWVNVRSLNSDQGLTKRELLFPDLEDERRLILPPWALFGYDSRFHAPPGFVELPRVPLLYCPPPRESRFAQAVGRIARKKLYSESRRWMKREWRRTFHFGRPMSYAEYERRLRQINRIGKEPGKTGALLEEDYFANQLREDVFGRSSRQGEADFALLAWGPLVVMDSGSVRLDLGRLAHLDSLEFDEVKLEEDEEDGKRPFLSSVHYRIRTAVRLGFDPIDAYGEGDPTWLIDRYGLNVSIDWLSDVLGRKLMTTEFEVEFEREGEFAAMVNFVFKSRS